MRTSAAGSFFLAVFALLGPAQAGQLNDAAGTNPDGLSSGEVCAFQPDATVSDACASYQDLDTLNTRIHPYVRSLCTQTDFFSYYRLNLFHKVCPFWSDENGMCGNIACAVNTIDNEEDIPSVWRAEELSRLEGPKAQHPGKKQQKERPERPLMGELGENVDESCVVEYDDECDERDYCVPEDESATSKGDYVSLLDNPERFTGYSGEGTHQVWKAIYQENCFSKQTAESEAKSSGNPIAPFGGLTGSQGQAAQDLKSVMKEHGRQQAMQTGGMEDKLEFEDTCLEKRVFYRVVSGLHASISTHLCYDYLNQTTGQWGPNLECYKWRLHKYPERISNLYFNFALVSRAVSKLKDYVQDYTFCTGDPVEDRRTKQMIIQLAEQLPAGSEIFDESVMFQDNYPEQTGITLKEDFRNRFRNVSRIMDCVGCDKCRLWGKLQTNGFGTALKVLFEFGDNDVSKPKPTLRRTELVALINLLDKISSAIKAVKDFREMIASEQGLNPGATAEQLEDDDYSDSDTEKDSEAMSAVESALDELDLFWRAFKYIVGSWFRFPIVVWHIFLLETGRLWQRWLGLEIWERNYGFEFPTVEDLYKEEL
ncbi:hypothetical protein AAFC00_000441 [Neodothiora populina]|uniref:Endoplasmic oxidoreductin-1 n=1 Tax=Neodothiora populina TaxID=2781224 RepID=A0ABR3PD57_9PEZI